MGCLDKKEGTGENRSEKLQIKFKKGYNIALKFILNGIIRNEIQQQEKILRDFFVFFIKNHKKMVHTLQKA